LALVMHDEQWHMNMVTSTFRAWRSCTEDATEHRRCEAVRQRRRPLRVALSEAQNEAADLRCKLGVAEARGATLQARTDHVLGALELLQSMHAGGVTGMRGDDVESSVFADPVDVAKLYEEVGSMQRLQAETLAELAGLQGQLQASGAVGTVRATAAAQELRDGRAEAASKLYERVLWLRAEHTRLAEAVAGLPWQGVAGCPHPAGTEEALIREIQAERLRNTELARRLDVARQRVTSLAAKHKSLVLSEGHNSPSVYAELPQVQKALCALAEVSEELLGAA